jgi:hypothetical protein
MTEFTSSEPKLQGFVADDEILDGRQPFLSRTQVQVGDRSINGDGLLRASPARAGLAHRLAGWRGVGRMRLAWRLGVRLRPLVRMGLHGDVIAAGSLDQGGRQQLRQEQQTASQEKACPETSSPLSHRNSWSWSDPCASQADRSAVNRQNW